MPYFSVWIIVVTTPRTEFEVDALGEILEGQAAVGEEAELDRGQSEFVAQLGIGLAQLARDAAEGGIDGEAGLGADDEQVERVGQALADGMGALLDLVLQPQVGRLVGEQQRAGDEAIFLERAPGRGNNR